MSAAPELTSTDTGCGSQRLRLLVVSSYLPGVGGGELQTALQVKTLAQRGHALRVLDLGSNPGAPAVELIDGVTVERFRGPAWPFLGGAVAQLRFFLRLRQLLKHVDIVQFNHLGLQLLSTHLLTCWAGIPLVLVVWGSSRQGVGPFSSGWRQALSRWAARRIRYVVALGSETRDNLIARRFQAERIEVISNGVDMARFGGAAAAAPAAFPESRPVVVAVGRLVAAKGYDVLLDAWRDIAADSRHGTLVIVGDGVLGEELRAGIRARGLEERVFMAGLRRDIPAWLAHADIYVSSSRTEGMSNALLEAMATGLPVVATRVGGAEDVITSGENGVLVAPGSAQEMRAALQRLLNDEPLRRAMGRRSRQRAQREFSIDAIMDRYEQLFLRVVREYGRGLPSVHGQTE